MYRLRSPLVASRCDVPGVRAPKFLCGETIKEIVKRFTETARVTNRVVSDNKSFRRHFSLVRISLCNLCVLCVSVVSLRRRKTTTETQRTQRSHREELIRHENLWRLRTIKILATVRTRLAVDHAATLHVANSRFHSNPGPVPTVRCAQALQPDSFPS